MNKKTQKKITGHLKKSKKQSIDVQSSKNILRNQELATFSLGQSHTQYPSTYEIGRASCRERV